MTNNTAKMDILAERPILRDDEISEFDVVIELNSAGTSKTTKARSALNLCIVIDRSGSMKGEKLDTAKKSCIDIYNRLDEPDLFTVVVFDDTAQVIVNPQTPKNEVESRIQAIESGGMTNLALGWRLGLLELQTYGTDAHISRLILLSDGQANRGETKKSELARDSFKAREIGISTSTIGIGSDFVEEILEALAAESGGRFWYIQESRIEDIINEEFRDSLSVLIERPRVELVLPDGVKVSRQLNDLRLIGGAYRIRPITSNQIFNFAVRLESDPKQIKDRKVELKAILFDGEKVVNETTKELMLRPLVEYVASDDHPVVRSIVQQYEASKTDEMMREKLEKVELDFLKGMIVSEIQGMRVVKDKLDEVRNQETETFARQRMNREFDEQLRYFLVMEDMEVVLELVEKTNQLGAMSLAHDFQARWEKLLMHYMHGKQQRLYRKNKDEDLQSSFLQSALNLVDLLTAQFPSDLDILKIREKINVRLERYR